MMAFLNSFILSSMLHWTEPAQWDTWLLLLSLGGCPLRYRSVFGVMNREDYLSTWGIYAQIERQRETKRKWERRVVHLSHFIFRQMWPLSQWYFAMAVLANEFGVNIIYTPYIPSCAELMICCEYSRYNRIWHVVKKSGCLLSAGLLLREFFNVVWVLGT